MTGPSTLRLDRMSGGGVVYLPIAVLLAASLFVGENAGASSCPPPTAEAGDNCVLTGDVVIVQPIELGAFAWLNCRGHRIMPTMAGSGSNPADYVPSEPETAIIITGERGARVQNCVLGATWARFDFGIFAIDSKNPGRQGHRILNNEIHSRESGVTFLRVDDALVNGNLITWTTGSGIRVRRDSNRNRVTNNVLTSPGAPPSSSRIVPGGAFFGPADDGIVLSAFPLHVLYNLVVDGRLYQFPNFNGSSYPGIEGNYIEGNVLTLPGSSMGKSHAGILVTANHSNTRIVGNTVVTAGLGIRTAGLRPEQMVQRVSHCVDAEGGMLARFCESDSDCFIPGVDAEPIGVCPTLQQDVVDLRGRAMFIEGNLLVGPFNSSIASQRTGIFGGAGTLDGIIRGNRVLGSGTEAGISLLGNMVESGLVTDNRIQDASIGILLSVSGTAVSHYGACVAFNDIINSTTRAVDVLGVYTLPTELSCNQSGNYWGHSRPPCFAPSDSPDPALIVDSHPFCHPVAKP